jgi:DME family drug/metabolite transporter
MHPEYIALVAALLYSGTSITARMGMQQSSPLTAACVALFVRTVLFWSALFLTGGIPEVELLPVLLFILLGVLQTATSLLQLTGIHRLGAARAEPLRNTYPLWSALIAIVFLREHASQGVLGGTALVVGGIGLISWQRARPGMCYRALDSIFPLLAALFAGVAFPVRRVALSISDEPLFFAAILAIVSFVSLGPYLAIRLKTEKLVWNRRALRKLVLSGCLESGASLLSLIAISMGHVVIVTPIVATTPLWTLILTVIFLRGVEQINARTVTGTFAVMAGTISIILSR